MTESLFLDTVRSTRTRGYVAKLEAELRAALKEKSELDFEMDELIVENKWLTTQLEAARKVVEVANQLLAFPNKSLIPWTEWTDLRSALTKYEEATK